MSELDGLPYDRIAFKAAHNSIDRLPELGWQDSIVCQLSGTGGLSEPCRALELDLVQEPDRFEWTVKHGVNDEGPQLREVLDVIASWADRPENDDHPVVTIHLDLKNDPLEHEDFARAIDELLAAVLDGDRIYPPVRVIGPHEDLVRGED